MSKKKNNIKKIIGWILIGIGAVGAVFDLSALILIDYLAPSLITETIMIVIGIILLKKGKRENGQKDEQEEES